MRRFATIAAIALMAAACAPPADDTGTDTDVAVTTAPATPGAAGMPQVQAQLLAPDAETLHAFLLANEDGLVPSDWQTGEPAGQDYWDFPDSLGGLEASAECARTGGERSEMDCTLTIAEPGDAPDGPRSVLYRALIGYTPEGELTLLSPYVRWATMG